MSATFQDDAFKEKSLYGVFKASKQFGSTAFNRNCMIITFLCNTLYVIANAIYGVENENVLAALTKLSSSIITVTTAILGFLIAGFSIFISTTPNQTLKMLLATEYKETKLSCFKQIMFAFLNVFTVYLVAMAVAIAINTATPLGWSPLISIDVDPRLVSTFNSLVLALLVSVSVYSILRLKSFIWTMYQSLIVNVMLNDTSA